MYRIIPSKFLTVPKSCKNGLLFGPDGINLRIPATTIRIYSVKRSFSSSPRQYNSSNPLKSFFNRIVSKIRNVESEPKIDRSKSEGVNVLKDSEKPHSIKTVQLTTDLPEHVANQNTPKQTQRRDAGDVKTAELKTGKPKSEELKAQIIKTGGPELDQLKTEPKSDQLKTEPELDQLKTEPKLDQLKTEDLKTGKPKSKAKKESKAEDTKTRHVKTELKSDQSKTEELKTELQTGQLKTQVKTEDLKIRPVKTEVKTEDTKTRHVKTEVKSDRPKTGKLKTEDTKTSHVKTVELKTEGFKLEEHKSDQPKTELKADLVKSGQLKSEGTKTRHVKTEVKSDEHKSEELKTENTKTRHVKTGELKPKKHKSDQLKPEELKTPILELDKPKNGNFNTEVKTKQLKTRQPKTGELKTDQLKYELKTEVKTNQLKTRHVNTGQLKTEEPLLGEIQNHETVGNPIKISPNLTNSQLPSGEGSETSETKSNLSDTDVENDSLLKPYLCERCSRRFKTKRTLARHQRVSCSVEDILKYSQIHTEGKSLTCPYCRTLFKFSSNLDKHVKNYCRVLKKQSTLEGQQMQPSNTKKNKVTRVKDKSKTEISSETLT